MVNLAINGVGRIGKLVLKLLISKNFKIKYLNELNGDSASLLHSPRI
jgi:glyceraldehyde-3-phosphate dehydrogenase/erythrose-4-phosphate dehydrogenase